VFFTAAGLHERPRELKRQLGKQLAAARRLAPRVIVVYGARCYVDPADPSRDVDALIAEHGAGARRIPANNCVDMIAGAEERERIAAGRRVYWLTPGWLRHWDFIFRDWDEGMANETFPRHDVAIVLDGVGYLERLMDEQPEKLLRISDWMKLPIEPVSVSLNRFKGLLADALARLAP